MDNIREGSSSPNLIKCKKDFIYNALEDGWTVHKQGKCYVFKKKHEGKKEVYFEGYLQNFIEKLLT